MIISYNFSRYSTRNKSISTYAIFKYLLVITVCNLYSYATLLSDNHVAQPGMSEMSSFESKIEIASDINFELSNETVDWLLSLDIETVFNGFIRTAVRLVAAQYGSVILITEKPNIGLNIFIMLKQRAHIKIHYRKLPYVAACQIRQERSLCQ